MHLTVLEFTSILPVPFPEIQILIIIDKNIVLFVNCRLIQGICNRFYSEKTQSYPNCNCSDNDSSDERSSVISSDCLKCTERTKVDLEHVENAYFCLLSDASISSFETSGLSKHPFRLLYSRVKVERKLSSPISSFFLSC